MLIKQKDLVGLGIFNNMKEYKESMSALDVILLHSFPSGKDEDGNPKFTMYNPTVDYVLDIDLKKIIKVIHL